MLGHLFDRLVLPAGHTPTVRWSADNCVDIVLIGYPPISRSELLVDRFHLIQMGDDVPLLVAIHLVESAPQVRLLVQGDSLDASFNGLPHFSEHFEISNLHVD